MPPNQPLRQPPQPPPSSLTTLLTTSPTPKTPYWATTTQILHNLQHQHLWTSLQIHEFNGNGSASSQHQQNENQHQHQQQQQQQDDQQHHQNPTTLLISGIPPTRIYTHPDEQLYLLEQGLRESDIPPERVFVLPTVRGQSWSLGRLAAVFDLLSFDPLSGFEAQSGSGSGSGSGSEMAGLSEEKRGRLEVYFRRRSEARATGEWGGKRLLLAMVDKGFGGEGTVVYYVVQEGAVKPRQN